MESGKSFLGGLIGRPLTPLLAPPADLVPIMGMLPMPIPIPIPMPIPWLRLRPWFMELWSTPRDVRVSGELCPPPIPRLMPLTPMVLMMGMATVVGVVVSAFLFTPFFCG